MILLLENYAIIHGMVNYKKGCRVILYHPETMEYMERRIISARVIDLLTNQAVYVNLDELNDLSKIGTLLS